MSATEPLRAPCPTPGCGSMTGRVTFNVNGQDLVRCAACGRGAFNLPRRESGRPQRSVRSHPRISPRQRARIVERDLGACVFCHQPRPLHIAHLLSVDDAKALGVDDELVWCDENLVCACAEDNLGQGGRSVTPRLFAALLRAWQLRARKSDAA